MLTSRWAIFDDRKREVDGSKDVSFALTSLTFSLFSNSDTNSMMRLPYGITHYLGIDQPQNHLRSEPSKSLHAVQSYSVLFLPYNTIPALKKGYLATYAYGIRSEES